MVASNDGTLSLDSQSGFGEDGLATYVAPAAIAFNNAALPPNMPEWMKAAIQAKASAIRDTMQSEEVRLTELQQRQDDDREEQIGMWQAAAAREREEWAHTQSTVAGVTMTGAEWTEFADRLRQDEELRRRLIEAFEAKGATHAEAELRVDKVADAADAAATPLSQRTDEQKKLLTDPQVGTDLRLANSFRQKPEPAVGLSGQFEQAVIGMGEPDTSAPSVSAPRPVTTLAPGMGF